MRLIPLAAAGMLSILWGQAPNNIVIDPRGVVNAFSRVPAPSRAGRGGLIEIGGFNLGPPEGAKAPDAAWPTELGGVQVLINGTAAPLGSADPARIVAQIPMDAEIGLADVVVKRESVSSRPARIFITAIEPSVRTVGESGYGQPFGEDAGAGLSLTASGLGPAEGDRPAPPVLAYIGGIRAGVSATPSTTRAGEFDVQIDIPAGARAGDLINLIVGGREANATVFRPSQDAELQYLPLPAGAPELRRLTDTDLNGNYLIGSGARDSQGCFPSVIFDFAAKSAAPVADCLTASNASGVNLVAASASSDKLAALVGPPQGEAPAGISSKVEIFSPSGSAPLAVDLPGAALNLNGGASGNFSAMIPGTPPQLVLIDGQTGELRPAGGAANPGGGAGGGLGVNVDVDGLTHVLSAAAPLSPGRVAVVVGDDADQPRRAKFAVIANGAVVQSRDFPEGWLPLLAPVPANRVAAAAGRESVTFDPERRIFYALARTADQTKHGMIAFPLDRPEARPLPFPDGWYAAACASNIRIFTLDLSRRLVIAGSSEPAVELRTPCTAFGFIQLDLNQLSAPRAVPLGGQAQMNGALGPDNEINDYIYSGDVDAERDTVYVLDGVTGSAYALRLPTGIRSYQALSPIPEVSALAGAVTTGRIAGNAGIALFDLAAAQVRILPVPDGFATIAQAGVFPATRKLVARGFTQGNDGAQLLIYDLNTGDLTGIVPNPEGVAYIGPRPVAGGPAPGGGGGGPGPGPGAGGGAPQALNANALLTANPKANTVSAVAFDSGGKQTGVVAVRIP